MVFAFLVACEEDIGRTWRQLADGVVGYVRASDISRDRVDDATTVLKVGDSVEAKFMNVDRKSRQLSLSIRAKDEAEEKEALESLNEKQQQEAAPTAMAAAFAAASNKAE